MAVTASRPSPARRSRSVLAALAAVPIAFGMLVPSTAHAVPVEPCLKAENVSLTLTPPSTLEVTWEWPANIPIYTHVVSVNEDPYDIGSDNPAYTGVTDDTHWSFVIDWVPGREYEVSVVTSCIGIFEPSTSVPVTITVPSEPETPSEPEVPSEPESPEIPEGPAAPGTSQTPEPVVRPEAPAGPVTAPPSSAGAELAATGVNVWPGALLGALLVTAGLGAIWARRKRASVEH